MLPHSSITSMLRLVREELGMDMTFVAELADGQRVFQHGDGDAGTCVDSAALATSPDAAGHGACHRMLLQHPDGRVYGTLCCFGVQDSAALGERERNRLKMAASLLTSLLMQAESG